MMHVHAVLCPVIRHAQAGQGARYGIAVDDDLERHSARLADARALDVPVAACETHHTHSVMVNPCGALAK